MPANFHISYLLSLTEKKRSNLYANNKRTDIRITYVKCVTYVDYETFHEASLFIALAVYSLLRAYLN